MALVIMNQRLAGSPSGRQASMVQPTPDPNQSIVNANVQTAALLEMLNSQQAQSQNVQQQHSFSNSIFRSPSMLQANATTTMSGSFGGTSRAFNSGRSGLGSLGEQNKLLYSDALNRMLSNAVAIAGTGSASGTVTSGNSFQHNTNRQDITPLASLYGSRVGMGLRSGTSNNGLGINISTLQGTGNVAYSNTTDNRDQFTAAIMRENTMMRGRLLAQGWLQLSSSLPFGTLSENMDSNHSFLNSGRVLPALPQTRLHSFSLQGRTCFTGASDLHQPRNLLSGATGEADPTKFPAKLPCLLAVPEDTQKLSSHQVFLRNQIEAFQATKDDLTTHTRGRNKPIKVGQVGIRCVHCAHLPVARRQKGSTYFPASLHGLYQAAQNMNTTHMQSCVCTEMPEEHKIIFREAGNKKVSSSVAGRPYWAKTARQLGLIDGEDGIRFVRDLTPAQLHQLGTSQAHAVLQRQAMRAADKVASKQKPGAGAGGRAGSRS